MSHDGTRADSPLPPGAGRLWRWLAAMVISIAARTRLKIVFVGPRRFRLSPGTLVVMNHKKDWDGPAMAPYLFFSGGPGAPNRSLSFLVRGDLNRPGFLPTFFFRHRPALGFFLRKLSLTPITRALGIRVVPGLGDPEAGGRRDRVAEIRAHLADAATQLDKGGCVLLAPEGQLTPDGSLCRLSGALVRLAAHAQVLQPITLTYDLTARRTRLFIRVDEPVGSPRAMAPKDIEKLTAHRLRGGTVFALGQVVAVLEKAGLPAQLLHRREKTLAVAAAARETARALVEAGCQVDQWLIHSTPKEIEGRLRWWLKNRAFLPEGSPGSLAYCGHEAEDGLSTLPAEKHREVEAVARAMAAAVAAPAGTVPAAAPQTPPAARRGIPQPVLELILGLATVAAVVLGLRAVSFQEIIQAMGQMDASWVFWAVVFQLAGYAARVPVWQALLHDSPTQLSAREAFDLYVAGSFINMLVPFRGGDAARVVYLTREANLGWLRAGALVASEHAFDLVIITGYGLAGLFLTRAAPAWARRTVLIFTAGTVAAVTVLLLLRPLARLMKHKGQAVLAALAVPGDALRNPHTRAELLAGITLTNLAGPASTIALFRAAGLAVPAGPFLIATALVTIGVGMPLTIGNLGTYELIFSAVYGLFMGYSTRSLVPVAVVLHASGLALLAVLGPAALMHLGREIMQNPGTAARHETAH